MRRALRAKTGCSRCRIRRKKCNEVKPVCGACRRWNFACIWPRPGDDLSATCVPSGCSSLVPRAVNGHGVSAFRDQTQLSFLQNFGSVYQISISELAGSVYKNLSPVFSVALDHAWTRDALNAFTGYMLYAQSRDDMLKDLALSSYQMAVVGMKNRLSRPVQHGQELALLVAATFLGGVELIGTGNADLALGHFAFVARLGQPLFARPCLDQGVLALYRIILEGVVYNLAYQSMFHSIPDIVLQAVDWTHYDRILRQPPGSAAPDYQVSPHFGGNHEYYRLILEITCFSRQSHGQDTRTSQVHRWLLQIEYLEQRLETYYVGAPITLASLYTAKYRLFGLALRICCLKVRDHDLRAWHPSAATQVRKAQQIFMHSALAEAANPVLAWPFVVFLCASPDHTTFQFISQEVEKIKANFGIGPLRHIEALISHLRHRHQEQARGVQAVEWDNLGILLCKRGITEPFS